MPPPLPRPPYVPPQTPYPGIVRNTGLAAIVVLSVALLFFGAMMGHLAPQLTNKDYTDDESGSDQREADGRTAQTLANMGRIVADIGAFFLLLILLLAGLLRTDWSDYVRFGVLFFVAVFAFSLGFRL